MSATSPAPAPAPAPAPEFDRRMLLRVIGSSIVVALPISLVAMGFLSLVSVLQEWVWQTAPADLGFDAAPWWWPIPWLLLAGLLVSAAILVLPGPGGHIPAHGTGGPPTPPAYVPGVFLAAIAGLPLGVVLGPEAPLIAMGYGLAVWISRVVRLSPGGRLEALIGTAGAAAAIAIVLGNPLTAVIFLAEAVAITGGPVIIATLAALLGVGVGAILFTGLGSNEGIQAQSLQLVELDSVPTPDIGDLLWAVPVGIVAGIAMSVLFTGGLRVADRVGSLTRGRLVAGTMAVGLAVALCASAYSLITGRDPFDVASSGTETLKETHQRPVILGGHGAGRPDRLQGHRVRPVAGRLPRRSDLPVDHARRRPGRADRPTARTRTGRRDRRGHGLVRGRRHEDAPERRGPHDPAVRPQRERGLPRGRDRRGDRIRGQGGDRQAPVGSTRWCGGGLPGTGRRRHRRRHRPDRDDPHLTWRSS